MFVCHQNSPWILFLFIFLLLYTGNANQIEYTINDYNYYQSEANNHSQAAFKCSYDGEKLTLDQSSSGRTDANCYTCTCKNKNLLCSRKECPTISLLCPLIEPSEEDSCCPECSKCKVKHGKSRQHGAIWASSKDKCTREMCQTGVTTQSRMHCITDCENPIRMPKACCHLCPIRKAKRLHFDPCVRCEIIFGLFEQCFKLACPVLNCPLDQQIQKSDQCCPECSKQRKLYKVEGSCEFRNAYYNINDAFRPDVCSRCECSQFGVICKRFVCPPNCRNPKYLPQVCCPFCDRSKESAKERLCYVQINGQINMYKEADEWHPEPCSICKCSNGEISCQTKTCPSIKCHEYVTNPKDKCCSMCKENKGTTSLIRRPREPHCTLSKKGMITSFDGDTVKLDSGPCEFVMTQRCALDGNSSPFIITIKTSSNGMPKKIGIELNVQNGFRLGKMYLLHGKELKYRNRRIKLPRESDRFRAFVDSNNDLNVKLHGTGVVVKWGPKSDIHIVAEKSSNSHILCGLCGNFNGHPSDDHWPQFGLGPAASTFEFIESWKTDSECGIEDLYGQSERDILELETEEDEEVEDHCSKILSPSRRAERRKYSRNCKKMKRLSLLSSCRSILPYSAFLKDCTIQVCKCEERSRRRKRQNHRVAEPCYCRPIHNYVGECARRGLLTIGGEDLMELDGRVVLHPKCNDFKLGM